MQKVNTYTIITRSASICLLAIFVFAVTQSARAHDDRSYTHAVYQSHVHHVSSSFQQDNHELTLNVRSPLIGATWTMFALNYVSQLARTSRALDVNINEHSVFFITPSIHAP